MPAVSEQCREVMRAVDGAVACGILGLEEGVLLGYHAGASGMHPDALKIVAAAARELFIGSVSRLAVLARGADDGAHLHEIHLGATHHHIFAKHLVEQRRALVLVTEKSISIGMGWAMLRSKLDKLGRAGS